MHLAGTHIQAQKLSANDVNVGVRLGLQSIVAEVGEDAEAIGRMLLTKLHGKFADPNENVPVAPELGLRHVAARRDK